MDDDKSSRLRCFLAIPFRDDYRPVRDALRKGVLDAGARSIALDEQPTFRTGLNEVVQYEMARADCVIADVTAGNPNVFFEVGLAQALGKRVILCINSQSGARVPSDLQGFFFLEYTADRNGLSALAARLAEALRDLRRLPRRARFAQRYSAPFTVDWDQLEPAETENLCLELLAQMGFRRVDWSKEMREFDLVAELPKKDPDGFEYRELWLVSMGRRMPPEMLISEADYFLHHLFRRSERFSERLLSRYSNSPVTMLIVFLRGDPDSGEVERLLLRAREEASTRLKMREGPFGSVLRFRFWDRAYLTSLVQQFPQIGYKYFSDDGRAQSKYRKSPEELYAENVTVTEQLALANANLKAEKTLRVRAERDAIWKDISFSAAHKIGNPIFAIETDLAPLDKRVREARTGEAIEVVANIRSSVEKAKAIIDQFKSLANAQKLTLCTTLLKPVLDDAMRVPKGIGVACSVECPDDLTVYGDADRLGECFDELAVNSTHWFDKPEKKVVVAAKIADSAPSGLDPTRRYAVVHFQDNGKGVALAQKEKIFDAFVTTYEHGTGLGLALTRRVIEGHGGTISEIGKPGQGADFEIYLPLDGNVGDPSTEQALRPRTSGAATKRKPKSKKASKRK